VGEKGIHVERTGALEKDGLGGEKSMAEPTESRLLSGRGRRKKIAKKRSLLKRTNATED